MEEKQKCVDRIGFIACKILVSRITSCQFRLQTRIFLHVDSYKLPPLQWQRFYNELESLSSLNPEIHSMTNLNVDGETEGTGKREKYWNWNSGGGELSSDRIWYCKKAEWSWTWTRRMQKKGREHLLVRQCNAHPEGRLPSTHLLLRKR